MIWLGVATGVFVLIAIFGVRMANFAMQFETRLPPKKDEWSPELLDRLVDAEDKIEHKEPSAIDWVWWQDLGEIGYEIHLVGGGVWRGNRMYPSWVRYPDGTTLHQDHATRDALNAYHQQILWRTKESDSKHAHSLVKAVRIARDPGQELYDYQLKLLNGFIWQSVQGSPFTNNPNSWRRAHSPDGVVCEAAVKIYRDLDQHLAVLRAHDVRVAADQERGLIGPTGIGGPLFNNMCGGCSMRAVSIPGGICRQCREAQGGGA